MINCKILFGLVVFFGWSMNGFIVLEKEIWILLFLKVCRVFIMYLLLKDILIFLLVKFWLKIFLEIFLIFGELDDIFIWLFFSVINLIMLLWFLWVSRDVWLIVCKNVLELMINFDLVLVGINWDVFG